MARLGMRLNSKKDQAIAAELESIIEDMARAMRYANRSYMSMPVTCSHDNWRRFTPAMDLVWTRYYEFCKEHPND
jgi:hypothetical protein